LVPTDGSRKPELLIKGSVQLNDWSSDGRYLLYMDFRNGGGVPTLGYFDFQSRSENSYAAGGGPDFAGWQMGRFHSPSRQ
jgi:hypothetical protein